jgi:hypothetical protein
LCNWTRFIRLTVKNQRFDYYKKDDYSTHDCYCPIYPPLLPGDLEVISILNFVLIDGVHSSAFFSYVLFK